MTNQWHKRPKCIVFLSQPKHPRCFPETWLLFVFQTVNGRTKVGKRAPTPPTPDMVTCSFKKGQPRYVDQPIKKRPNIKFTPKKCSPIPAAQGTPTLDERPTTKNTVSMPMLADPTNTSTGFYPKTIRDVTGNSLLTMLASKRAHL